MFKPLSFFGAYCSLAQNINMRKGALACIMVLLVVASCSKKAAPTKNVAIDGALVYKDNCARCHGSTGSNGDRGPDLKMVNYSKKDLTDVIFNGGGKMPSFGDKISSKEISAVADFVLNLKK